MVITYQQFISGQKQPIKLSLISIYCLLTFSVYFVAIQETSDERLEKGIQHPQAKEMFNYVLNNTDINDTIVFRKPRIMALVTQRTSTAYPNPQDETPHLIDRYFDAIEGDFFVDMKLKNWMLPLTDSTPPSPKFTEVFRNTYFQFVLKILAHLGIISN